MKLLVLAIGSVFIPLPALATFGCDLVPTDQPVQLLATPKDDADLVLVLPSDAIVSLFDNLKTPAGWAYVAYSSNPGAYWGEGEKGWVKSEQLGECG